MTDLQVEARQLSLDGLELREGADPRTRRPAARVTPEQGHTYFLATDWKVIQARSQSDLPYHWQDGVPTLPGPSMRRTIQLAVKRWIDVLLSLVGIVVLLPLFAAVGVAIKLTSSGPILFRQIRTGIGGKPFSVLKFRTMHMDRCDPSGRDHTVHADERVTPIGRFLRTKSIDELPQLFNVLVGHMSLVGPRPHVPGMRAAGALYESVVPYYPLRHAVRPGITGWAQANGLRGPTESIERAIARVDHDIAYIQNFSLWLDIRTLAITVWKELSRGTGT